MPGVDKIDPVIPRDDPTRQALAVAPTEPTRAKMVALEPKWLRIISYNIISADPSGPRRVGLMPSP